jgi:hypothetical protein
METYDPQPIDTSAIVLADDIRELTEKLAANTHEVWARTRISQGWSYGPQRDDRQDDRPERDADPDALDRLHFTLAKKVFLSYRHGDSKDVVRGLAGVLKKRGWEVVWDEDGLQVGGSISTFVDQVRLTPFLVPVLSRTYHESRWCLSELFGFVEGQECRFERLSERAVGALLEGVEIDQPEHRARHAKQLQSWCEGRAKEAAFLAPRDVELLQFMQAWYPRMARVLERLSDPLLPRGTSSVSENDFRAIVETLEARYAAATRR